MFFKKGGSFRILCIELRIFLKIARILEDPLYRTKDLFESSKDPRGSFLQNKDSILK